MPGLRWLSVEVKYLAQARRFYEENLSLPVKDSTDSEVVFDAGDTELVLRKPGDIPRGGVHTHYAFSTPSDRYDDWKNHLSKKFDIVEHDFGGSKSLYFYDLDDHCIEIGQRGTGERDITGIFEVVLEVEDIQRSIGFYELLGGSTYGGSEPDRTRLDMGGFDLEIWLPRLGIADGQGGVHVDIGIELNQDIDIESLKQKATLYRESGQDLRLGDPDGHYVTLID